MKLQKIQKIQKTLLALFILVTGCAVDTSPVIVDSDGYADTLFDSHFAEHLRILASDEFEGRAPASRGEILTIDYATRHFRRLDLEAPFGDSYLQPVPLVRYEPVRVSDMLVRGNELELSFRHQQEMTAQTRHVVDRIDINDSELVFVGYGVVAPEYDWNDYEGLDASGKTVVMLVNDPGYAIQDDDIFDGNAMTYYGRWTYKFEEAARQGAAAAIIIHETGPAGYGWEVIAGGSPVYFDLARENLNMDQVQLQAWISTESAQSLFSAAGSSLEEMRELALDSAFEPVSLESTLSISIENNFEYVNTHNIVAMMEGSRYPEEHILYMAHWDHLGVDPATGEIYNGAQDNASGSAGVLSIAERFALGPVPERSIVFLLVGAEERGLLGSAWYADEPVLPLSQAVAGVNMDVMNVYGPMRDFVVVGWENSDLQEYVEPFVRAQNRYLAPETNPEAGIFYRSDHFSLARQGVPVLYAKGGNDHFEHGEEWGREQREVFNREAYHQPGDEYDENWDLRGAQQDLWLYYRLGEALANSRAWPAWAPGNEFEAVRQQSAGERRQ